MEGREHRSRLSKFFCHIGSYLKKKDKQTQKWEKKTVEAVRQKFEDVGKYLDYIPILPIRFRMVDQFLFGSICPMSIHEFRTIRDFFNIKVIVNLNFSTLNSYRYFTIRKTEVGIAFRYYDMDEGVKPHLKDFLMYHFPVPEGCTPNDEQLKGIRDIIKHHIQAEENILFISFSCESLPWSVIGNYLIHYRNSMRVKEFMTRLPKNIQLSESQHQLLNQNWNDNSETVMLFQNHISHILKVGSYKVPDITGCFTNEFYSYNCIRGQRGKIYFKRQSSKDRSMIGSIRKFLSFQTPVMIGTNTFLTYDSLGREMERIMNIIRFKSGNENEEDLKFYMEFLFHIEVRNDKLTFLDHEGIERADRKKIDKKRQFEERKKSILGRIEEEKLFNLRLDKLEEVFGVISEKIIKTKEQTLVLEEKRGNVKERRLSFKKRVQNFEKSPSSSSSSYSIQMVKKIQQQEEQVFKKKGARLKKKEVVIKSDIRKLEKKQENLFREIYHLQEMGNSYRSKKNKDDDKKNENKRRRKYTI